MAQALGAGAVKLQDWKSITNVNMDTVEFKTTALETAVALGQLTKVEDGLYQTTKGTDVTIASFNETLKEGWFSSNVLIEVLTHVTRMSRLFTSLLVPTCAYIVIALALNLVVGFSGELSLGHAGFMCVGAFVAVCVAGTISDTVNNDIIVLIYKCKK